MRRIIFISFVVCLCFSLSGCATYEITPEIENRKSSNKKINSYSYDILSPYEGGYFERKSFEVTKDIFKDSMRTDNVQTRNGTTHVVINIKRSPHGGACGPDFLTGLSLGIIPSWCTRPKMYFFNYQLFQNGRFCTSITYAIDETDYGHIILLPFGLFELSGIYHEPLNLYEESLLSFLESEC